MKWTPKNALIFKIILSTNPLRKCMKISLENLYVDIGADRIKGNVSAYERKPVVLLSLARSLWGKPLFRP